jgi:hypothetical protein
MNERLLHIIQVYVQLNFYMQRTFLRNPFAIGQRARETHQIRILIDSESITVLTKVSFDVVFLNIVEIVLPHRPSETQYYHRVNILSRPL